MIKRNWTTSPNVAHYSTLNNEHNGEDLCTKLRNQQTYTSVNRNQIKGALIFNPILQNFIMGLLMQHKFCGVNPIGIS